MKNEKLILWCLIINLIILTSCTLRKPSQYGSSDLKCFKSVILPMTVVDDSSLIQTINRICEISNRKLKANTNTNDSWQCGVSFTVLPVSENNKLMKKTIEFNNLTIYEAFGKISKEYGLKMQYNYGRFIFSDPSCEEEADLDFSESNNLNVQNIHRQANGDD